MSTQKRRYELKARAEAQQATRARIAEAAATLHEEVGIGRTTVADIARRAGVQRLTVYNHFADLDALLPACTADWLGRNPMPDLGPALAQADPRDRLRATLAALYHWYRATAPMQRRVQGERVAVPELDEWLARSSDVAMTHLAEQLVDGLRHPRARALVDLALGFWTWERLAASGLGDEQAAELMAELPG